MRTAYRENGMSGQEETVNMERPFDSKVRSERN
jgi:hypothetical protein